MPNGKPNILVIWADDIGYWNISAYSQGVMGYKTPNIDRLAKEGMIFTDHYSEASCTSGRAAFLTGQIPYRTGLTRPGMPGDKIGLQPEDPTLAEILKTQGYRTGQFGKNHLGDRNEHLPTVHGFDEFMGNLYHLNTEEEPESIDYPKDPAFKEKFGPRGVLHSWAAQEDDPTEDPRFGRIGKQNIEDTGSLNRERMETIDEELATEAKRFIKDAVDANKPFFTWLCTTRMHVFTHLKAENRYLAAPYTSEHDLYGSGMMEHDMMVGQMLGHLDELGIADDTIVIYSTDNGPEHGMWPHGGCSPWRGEKMTSYEGGFRVPHLVRWPNHIPAGTVCNEIQCHYDVFVTLAAAAGVPDVVEKLRSGMQLGEKPCKVYIDGVNHLDLWTGKTDKGSREHFIYWQESTPGAFRWCQWKAHLVTRESYWADAQSKSMPLVINIRMDPLETFTSEDAAGHLAMRTNWLFNMLRHYMDEFNASLKEFPIRQEGGSFGMKG